MEKQVYRHELKYYLSPAGAALVRSRLKHLMRPDPHAKGFSPYFIRSLYFDDMEYSAYRDKLSGVNERNKYRLRFYNMDPSFAVFEKKQKIQDRIRKTSVRVDWELAGRLAQGRPSGASDGLLREYDILVKTRGLRPLVLVDYDRTVFSYPIGNVRITLDERLASCRFQGDLLKQAGRVGVIDPDEVVLEVKFDSVLPPQIRCLLEDIPKARSAISKYCLCCSVL